MKTSFGSGTRVFGLSVRTTNVLRNGEMVRESEAETRAVVREKIRSGEIEKHRNCGKKTVRELESWLATPCDETRFASCAKCAYWCREESVSEGIGVCRAHAPNPNLYGVIKELTGDAGAGPHEAWWPETGEADWCGDFKIRG